MTLPGSQTRDACETRGVCEWCGQASDRLEELRDWEEHGSFSPRVYSVCAKCVEKHNEGFEAASAEWAAYMEKYYVWEEQ